MTLGELRRRTQGLSDSMELVIEVDTGNKNEYEFEVRDVSYTTKKVFISN